ncbi:MAG TPA: hypothetical protein VF867_10080 [Arthrobacter sp.]
MVAWIETASGNLLNTASVGHILVKESTPGGTWEVVAATDAKSAAFATGLAGRPAARAVRNALAVAISAAGTAEAVRMICFEEITGTVCTEELI